MTGVRVQLRPTVAADLPHVIGESLPFRIRALTAYIPRDPSRTIACANDASVKRDLDDGSRDQVLGIGGLAYMPNGVIGAFVQMTAEGRKYPVAIHRAGVAAMRMIRESGERRVVALADELVPGAERWLDRLGFRPVTVDGLTAYIWEAE